MVLKPRFKYSIRATLVGGLLTAFGWFGMMEVWEVAKLFPAVCGLIGVLCLLAGGVGLATRHRRTIIIDDAGIDIPVSRGRLKRWERFLLRRDEIVHVAGFESVRGREVEVWMKNGGGYELDVEPYCEVDVFLGRCRQHGIPVAAVPSSWGAVTVSFDGSGVSCLIPRLAYRFLGIYILTKAAKLNLTERLRFLLQTRRRQGLVVGLWTIVLPFLLFVGICCAYPHFSVMVHLDKPGDEARPDVWTAMAFLLPAGLMMFGVLLFIATRRVLATYWLLLFITHYSRPAPER